MVHASSHLAFCWHFQQLLEDHFKEESVEGEECSKKKSRRQKFREQGGPSRESLQRSHIVSILRQIPSLPGLIEEVDCSKTEEEEEEGELPLDVLWPLSAVSVLEEEEIFRVDWNVVPESADPQRGFGYKPPAVATRGGRKQPHGGHDDDDDGKLDRGVRKRSQVESIATALKLLNLPAGSVVVDFGSGSGALSLPLAFLFKDFTFVCVDYKQESLRLLDVRAQAAKLNNITTWQGRIEDYTEPFETCVALHACGHATDLALMQALRWRAGYVVSPCCVGKLQFAVPSSYTPENLRSAVSTESGYVFPNLAMNGDSGEVGASLCLQYPRSQWLRRVVTSDEFLLLARTADWSCYEYESWTSRLHSLCKVMVELDRNQASRELGYRCSLLSLADRKAGAVGASVSFSAGERLIDTFHHGWASCIWWMEKLVVEVNSFSFEHVMCFYEGAIKDQRGEFLWCQKEAHAQC